MMKWTKFFLLTIGLITAAFSFGQDENMSVAGTVYDSTGTSAVENAMVMAVRVSDSKLITFTRTNAEGKFLIDGFALDTFSLIIDHPSFDEKTYYIFGQADNKDIVIPSVVMPPKSQEIEEVVIYAYKDPIYFKGDTLVYVADSFAVGEGAVVEDLLKKLPGISVDQDGSITSQGEEIAKVLVDGDEFFGSDPTIATKNLGADGIEEVQVYETENEDGIGDDEKIKVLDLKLKDDAKKGYFGRISGASDFALSPIDGEIGTNPFYEGELLLNKFDGAQKISVFALGSNTPRSNFGWGDMNKFGLENESGAGNRWNAGAPTNTSGIPQTLKAGIYYSDKIGKKKKTKIGFNYSYYRDSLNATSASRSEYFLTDTTYVTDDSISDVNFNESHRFNINFETQLDSLTTLQIKPSASIDFGRSGDLSTSDFFTGAGDQTIGTFVNSTNESKGYSVNGFAKINRKFKKKKRELEVRYDLALNDNETDGLLDSRTTYISSPLLSDTTRQSKLNNNSNTSHYGTVTYVEPIGKRFKTEFEYLFEYGFSDQDKRAYNYDPLSGVFSDTLDSDFSNIFDNTRQQHRGGVRLIYDYKKHTVSLGTQVRNIDINNVNQITDTTINQNFTNILPNFRYQFKPSMSKRFMINYRASSQQPSINDLQPVQDNTNPNRVQIGNPNLQPNYVHSINTMFNTWKAMTGRYVWAGGFLSLTDNAFADSISYDPYGRTQTKRVNVDGNMFGSVYSGAGFPFWGRKVELSPGFNASYFRNVSYILGQENVTTNYSVTPALKVKFSLLGDSLEMETTGSYAFNNAVSSLNGTSTPYSIYAQNVTFKWRMKHGITIGTDGTYTKNDQPGDGFYDTEFFVLNAEVSKKFLKTQNLEVALIGRDLLNQNINARREINGNVVTDYRTTIISRYFLMKVTLRFNNRRTREEDGGMWH